jgi:hypothetical protein
LPVKIGVYLTYLMRIAQYDIRYTYGLASPIRRGFESTRRCVVRDAYYAIRDCPERILSYTSVPKDIF